MNMAIDETATADRKLRWSADHESRRIELEIKPRATTASGVKYIVESCRWQDYRLKRARTILDSEDEAQEYAEHKWVMMIAWLQEKR